MLTGPRRAAVLGSPVAHSLSPLLHRTAYDALGLQGWTYEAREVRAPELAEVVNGLDERWCGLSLTMPLKEQALLVASESTPLALQVGAANTLVPLASGGWRADNTDVAGVREAIREAVDERPTTVRTAAVVGSGATARSVLAALAQLAVDEVTFVVRSGVRESTLAQAADHGLRVHEAPLDDVGDWAGADLLVNTTPAGAADGLAALLSRVPVPAEQVVLDVVYAGWPTHFARSRPGATVVGGIEMLVHQAAAQVHLMTGRAAPLAAMQRAGRAAVSG